MPGCPFRNFDPCPEHNKAGGCSLWLAYASNSGVTEAHMEGCALALSPMLLMENANALGNVAGEVDRLGAEISAHRVENAESVRHLVCTVMAAAGRPSLEGKGIGVAGIPLP